MSYCLFEDRHAADFYPLTELRPVWELRTGMGTLRERLSWRLEEPIRLGRSRPELQPLAAELGFENPVEQIPCLLNGRLLEIDRQELQSLQQGEALFQGEALLAWKPANAREARGELPRAGRQAEGRWQLAERLWDLVLDLPQHLRADWELCPGGGRESEPHATVVIQGEQNLRIAADVEIGAYTVIDARGGPVVIQQGARILPFCYIEGPCVIGRDCRLKAHTRLYEGCHLGPVSRVAGEIGESVIQGYSNKQHDGFLGHAYLGEWCNLGADTNNSDLKNNYGNVSVSLKGQVIQTGRRFVGLMMGDHSKTAINTMFNTGTVVGIFANIWGGGFPQGEVPAFSWGGPPRGFADYRVDKALSTAEIVVGRRGRELSPEMASLIRQRAAEKPQAPGRNPKGDA